MIRYRIQELISDKLFREGRRITLKELAEATGISRVTLSKMVNQPGYGTLTDHLDRLCKYFQCSLNDLAEYVPTEDVLPLHKDDPTEIATRPQAEISSKKHDKKI